MLGNNRAFIIPDNLSRNQLARDLISLQLTQCKDKRSRTEEIGRVALELRKAIQITGREKMSWPPKASELNKDAIRIPEDVKPFLVTSLTGSSSYKPNDPCQEKDQRLVNSFGQDRIFAVTNGRQKAPKHILPYAVKTLTNNVDVIRFLNRCGHGIVYSQIEEMNTALFLQKMASTPENGTPLPDNIQPHISTSLAWDNIDRLEETLSGGGTSYRVNGIAVQSRHFGLHLPPSQETPVIVKTKKGSADVLTGGELPIYNAGERAVPPPMSYDEVTASEIEKQTWKKNLLWMLVRLHAAEKQTVCEWTGFNILSTDDTEFSKDNIGYLPTIDAPATNMSTVFEVLSKSLKIKDTLQLKSIVLVFDQALYAKAIEIKWKHPVLFKPLVLQMGAFHTIGILLGIIGRGFKMMD